MASMMDRRAFVAATTVIAGRIATDRYSIAQAGPFAGKIKKAVKYHMIQEDLSVTDKFKLLKDLGFDGVEARVHLSKGVTPQQLLKACDVTGLPIHGVVNSHNPDIKTAIDRAKFYGASSVLVVVPTNAKGSYLENYRKRQQIIRDAVEYAEKHEIRLLIENVWASFLIEPLAFARFIDELDSPMVGAYFDVGNNVRWGYPEHWIEVLGKRVVKLDIKEYSRKLQGSQGLRAGFSVELGEGSVDWKRVREELAKINYTGWATAEVKGGDRVRLKDIARRMNDILGL